MKSSHEMTCLVSQDKRTALMRAASRGHAGIAKLLFTSGADVNAKDKVSIAWRCLFFSLVVSFLPLHLMLLGSKFAVLVRACVRACAHVRVRVCVCVRVFLCACILVCVTASRLWDFCL